MKEQKVNLSPFAILGRISKGIAFGSLVLMGTALVINWLGSFGVDANFEKTLAFSFFLIIFGYLFVVGGIGSLFHLIFKREIGVLNMLSYRGNYYKLPKIGGKNIPSIEWIVLVGSLGFSLAITSFCLIGVPIILFYIFKFLYF